MYEGRFHDNIACDVCKISYADQSTYLGDVECDLKHGWGHYKFHDGSFYKGEFRGETRCGQGEYFNSKKKTKYVGEYFLDMKHGKGKLVHPDGSFYEGEWLKNNMHGNGKLEKSNGNVYSGEFKDGKKHGQGFMKNLSEKWTYQGNWENGKFHGKGKL